MGLFRQGVSNGAEVQPTANGQHPDHERLGARVFESLMQRWQFDPNGGLFKLTDLRTSCRVICSPKEAVFLELASQLGITEASPINALDRYETLNHETLNPDDLVFVTAVFEKVRAIGAALTSPDQPQTGGAEIG